MKLTARTLSLISIILLISVNKSTWNFTSPLLPYFLVLVIYISLTFELLRFFNKKIIAWFSVIIGIAILISMYKLYPLLKSDKLLTTTTDTWYINNYKVKRYTGIFKRPIIKQQYSLYEYGFLKTIYREIDHISLQDTIYYNSIVFPKTNIKFNKTDLKINLP